MVKKEETQEEYIKKTGKSMFDDMKGRCEGKIPFILETKKGITVYSLVAEEDTKQGLCDCIVDTLNNVLPLLPKGEKTQTRRIFNDIIDRFNKEKSRKKITGCTKSLSL